MWENGGFSLSRSHMFIQNNTVGNYSQICNPKWIDFLRNICGHKSETMQCIRLKIGMGGKYHKYYKHTKFCQNPRGDPKFLVDLTRNNPNVR